MDEGQAGELMASASRRLGTQRVAARGVIFEQGWCVKSRSFAEPVSVGEFLVWFGRRLSRLAGGRLLLGPDGASTPVPDDLLGSMVTELEELVEAIRHDLMPPAPMPTVGASGRVRVVGDGTPSGTRVLAPDGGMVTGVMRLHFDLDAMDEPRGLLDLEIRGGEIDLGFEPGDITVIRHVPPEAGDRAMAEIAAVLRDHSEPDAVPGYDAAARIQAIVDNYSLTSDG